jgi:transposase
MARTHGRCAQGDRLRMGFPHGHRKTTTLVADPRLVGVVAPMDKLSSHKRASVKATIEVRGARLAFLTPYSPDFTPSRWPSRS